MILTEMIYPSGSSSDNGSVSINNYNMKKLCNLPLNILKDVSYQDNHA